MIKISGRYGYVSLENEKRMLHRENGPAYIGFDYQEWYQNGKYHRLNGPAMVYQDKTRYWYINGMEYSETEYHDKLKEMGVVV